MEGRIDDRRREAFAAACAAAGADGPAGRLGPGVLALYAEIGRRYGEEGRFYHTLTHVDAVLAVVGRLARPADLPALRLAAWLHDVVYDPRAADNEARSAAFAAERLAPLGVDPGLIQQVQQLILCTQTHEAADGAGHVLLDADLAILGAPAAAYDAYAAAVRREYAHVPELAYRAGRAQVLTRFLQRPAIFQTPVMRQTHEAAARANVARELRALAAR